LRRAYELMRRRFGHQDWWPGDTPFEVCVGAILTQNTAWRNVERAIANLRRAGALDPEAMLALREETLAELIRPAGYFRVKAKRLRAWLRVLAEEFQGSLDRLLEGETAIVRERLLDIYGIGPETADCMLLYAGNHLSFVVDAYTRRVFSRHGWSRTDASYDEMKLLCETNLAMQAAAHGLDYWQDYHAQLVQVGKAFCRAREARCEECPLRPLLPPFQPRVVVATSRIGVSKSRMG
jgi:endonuclease-3 related protein